MLKLLNCLALLFVSTVWVANLRADECTPPSSGPDVITTELVNVVRFGTVGGLSGYAIGSDLCNVGNAPLPWNLGIAQNLYRISNGRMEQIGMSWVKRVGIATTDSTYCTCIPPSDPFVLGIGCSDVYSAQMNGSQTGLGPRSSINAFTAFLPPLPGGQVSNVIERRLQIHDFVVAEDPNALFLAEIQLLAPDDASADNSLNNLSWEPCTATVSQQTGGWLFPSAGPTFRRQPAIYAWPAGDPDVTVVPIDVPGEGRMYLGYKVSKIDNATWNYEYALFNLNSHRSAGRFSIPVPTGVTVSDIGFHDVDYHSGEPIDSLDWTPVHDGSSVSWNAESYETNENANALRWGTLYNFRFDADSPPGPNSATLGLFRPGTPNEVTVPVQGPAVVVPSLSAGGQVMMAGLLAAAGWYALHKAGRHV